MEIYNRERKICNNCGYYTWKNSNILCPLCKTKLINLTYFQGKKLMKLSRNEGDKYIESILKHKISQELTEKRHQYIASEYEQCKKERENKEHSKISAYQTKYLSFLEEAQNQGIPRSRAEDIATYAMQHEMYSLPHCPSCGSVDANKISTGTKVAKTAAFGVYGAMSDSGKTWKCNKCGSRW